MAKLSKDVHSCFIGAVVLICLIQCGDGAVQGRFILDSNIKTHSFTSTVSKTTIKSTVTAPVSSTTITSHITTVTSPVPVTSSHITTVTSPHVNVTSSHSTTVTSPHINVTSSHSTTVTSPTRVTSPHIATPVTLVSTTGAPSTQEPDVCEDRIDTCDFYGHEPCYTQKYHAWARHFCALHCGFCTPNITVSNGSCYDKLPNCADFDEHGTLCTTNAYQTWAQANCGAYCKLSGCNASVAVHENWGPWSTWGSCSQTCGTGLQRRDRSCSGTSMSSRCQGSPVDFKVCQHGPCTSGLWSDWSEWSNCTFTCETIRHRERHCSNPDPTALSGHCIGSYIETEPCNCTDDGDLQVKLVGGSDSYNGRLEVNYNGTWGTVCDDYFSNKSAHVACRMLNYHAEGAYFKTLTIFEPKWPKQIWLENVRCSGDELSIDDCPHSRWGHSDCSHAEDVVVYCKPPEPSFTATDLVPGLTAGSVSFSRVLFGVGTNYNATTGKFTCSVPGIYYFTVSLTKNSAHGAPYARCFLRHNDGDMLLINVSSDDDPNSLSATVSLTLHLDKNDTVDIGSCSNASDFDETSSVFTGYLVKTD